MNLLKITFTPEASETIRKYCDAVGTIPDNLVAEWVESLKKQLPDEQWKEIEGW